jgi:hypothetical protein
LRLKCDVMSWFQAFAFSNATCTATPRHMSKLKALYLNCNMVGLALFHSRYCCASKHTSKHKSFFNLMTAGMSM